MSEPSVHHDQQQAHELDVAASRAPLHAHDRMPDFLLGAQGWLQRWLSSESRIVLGLVIVVLSLLLLEALSLMRFFRVFFDALDLVAFLGLFLVNWLGNGGALVPVPGARFIGLLMIFQQAMALGLLSYYVAGARTAQSYAEGDAEGAEQLAAETGMLDDETVDFSPGATIDAAMVSALSGVEPDDRPPPPAEAEADASQARFGGLRKRFTTSLRKAQDRARPVIEQRGSAGMFLLCFAPSPMGTAAAYLGGLMRFGFLRYLGASFAAKYLLAGIIVVLALVFSDAARAVQIPELTIPIVDITLFDDASPAPSPPPSG